ncbi:MAG: MlaD family protein [Kiritimatiellae bacterium]|jgi:paraquat-inducible protein B|nr:MlaD family protein [Kiritimatiellia bacterium]
MSRKANPAMVGVFIIGAVALLIAGIIIFGKGQLFKDTKEWVLYFDGSIKGLSPGSPVVFQGVRIGEVKDIRIYIDKEKNIRTPVIIEIDSSLIDFEGSSISRKESFSETMKMIDRGLCAQLQTQSLITGQLLVQLEFHPEREARLVSPGGSLPEMPTIPSTIQELAKNLNKLHIEDIVNNINSITKGLDGLINSPNLTNTLATVNSTLKKAESVLTQVEEHIDPISKDVHEVLTSTQSLLDNNNDKIASLIIDLEKTSVTTREEIQNIAKEIKKTTTMTNQHLSRFLETATTTSGYAEKMLSEQSEFRHELRETLAELESALRAIRLLAEYMEQHPESLISGKAQ